MKSIFLDANIIIDILANRIPFAKNAVSIFVLSEQKKVKLYTSSHTIATVHYLLKKYTTEIEICNTLLNLLEQIDIISIDFSILKQALQSKHKDFEDAIQIIAAKSISTMDCIITRNVKDFKDAGIKIYSPDEYLLKF
jgi:predicted nucleic acid-binding protein